MSRIKCSVPRYSLPQIALELNIFGKKKKKIGQNKQNTMNTAKDCAMSERHVNFADSVNPLLLAFFVFEQKESQTT
jgi:hypothetical protein